MNRIFKFRRNSSGSRSSRRPDANSPESPRSGRDRDSEGDIEPDLGHQSIDSARSLSDGAVSREAFLKEVANLDSSADRNDLVAGVLVGAVAGLVLWLLIFFLLT